MSLPPLQVQCDQLQIVLNRTTSEDANGKLQVVWSAIVVVDEDLFKHADVVATIPDSEYPEIVLARAIGAQLVAAGKMVGLDINIQTR